MVLFTDVELWALDNRSGSASSAACCNLYQTLVSHLEGIAVTPGPRIVSTAIQTGYVVPGARPPRAKVPAFESEAP